LKYKALFTKTAEKDIRAIEPKTRLKILKAVKSLETSPFPETGAVKKLKGTKIPLYRLRTGNFRIIFHAEENKIAVLFVTDRKDLQKKLKTLL
jgi:mRNA interferase RelE/StbE